MDRKPDVDDDRHPGADRSKRHKGDQALRAVGFEIVSRPRRGPNRWKRRQQDNPLLWDQFTEDQAHVFRAELIEAAVIASKRGKRK